METFHENPFETMQARIVSGDERQVMGVLRVGWGRWGSGDQGIVVFK